MQIAIMQPYFLPYIGYFQLIKAVDSFVVYDNVKYIKKGWINRNRYLLNGKSSYFTVPLKKDSDFLLIKERTIYQNFNKKKLLSQLYNIYRKSPYFHNVYSIIETILFFDNYNLFDYIFNSIKIICEYLGINTEIIVSSKINIDHKKKGLCKVISICNALKAKTYINPLGGKKLYSKKTFSNISINLSFIKSGNIIYKQFDNDFIPCLSIIDVMMFNSKEEIETMLNNYSLI